MTDPRYLVGAEERQRTIRALALGEDAIRAEGEADAQRAAKAEQMQATLDQLRATLSREKAPAPAAARETAPRRRPEDHDPAREAVQVGDLHNEGVYFAEEALRDYVTDRREEVAVGAQVAQALLLASIADSLRVIADGPR